MQKRTRLAREQRVQHVRDVSQRLFSTHAYDAIAIDDLATAAGMAQGLLYYYFAGKRELYVATMRHVLAQILQFTEFHSDLHTGLSETLSLFEWMWRLGRTSRASRLDLCPPRAYCYDVAVGFATLLLDAVLNLGGVHRPQHRPQHCCRPFLQPHHHTLTIGAPSGPEAPHG